MKFIRQRSPATTNDTLKRVIVENEDEIILDSKSSLQLSVGTENDRPITAEEGQIRFLITTPGYNPGDPITGYYEAYNNGDWREFRFKEPSTIVRQNFLGDGLTTQFGPLDNQDTLNPFSFVSNPESIFVFVGNVYQIPVTNYNITQVGPDYFLDFGAATDPSNPPPNDQVPVTILHNFDK